MTTKYLPQTFEKKWTEYWNEKGIYTADVADKKEKKYILDMFPYPSGVGLHVGHPRGYVGSDILTRFYRMKGYDVLHPMGWDAFGLPAENAAIKAKRNPKDIIDDNIKTFKKQLKMLGFSYDWSREINTADPAYYKWTQWLFIQFFKMGLLYKKSTPVYYCPFDKTGIAQEEVLPNGTHERCGTPIVIKELPQWIFRITTYADRLLNELNGLNWPEGILEMQKNWIGKSEGTEISFKLDYLDLGNSGIEPEIDESGTKFGTANQTIKVFTTRPDTLYGVTAIVLAPEHKIVHEILKGKIEIDDKIKANIGSYVKQAQGKMDLQRTDLAKEKTGVPTSLNAIHPLTGEKIPIWIADYVLGHYGYGAVMSVPAHDERDYEFAKKYNLSIKEVIQPLLIQSSNIDALMKDEPLVKRDIVMCIVKHWSEDKYLCIQWKDVYWRGFVSGGIEKGEDDIEAGKREIKEESGYLSAKFVKKLGDVVHMQFYHVLKKVNRWAISSCLYFELQDGKRAELSHEEKNIQESVWLTPDEVGKFLNVEDAQLYWNRFIGKGGPYVGKGILTNSNEFNGLDSVKAKKAIINKLKSMNAGKQTAQYKLRDWIFSRQRYWGEPIPMVYCPECAGERISYWDTQPGKTFQKQYQNISKVDKTLQENLWGWFPIDEKSLPLQLPYVDSYEPTETAESPLTKIKKWVETQCPNCGTPAKRETDTMPNWAGSCWYFLRFADPHNEAEAWGQKAVKKWMPVDIYIGGAEHAVLHLLYSRFWIKALQDLGFVDFNEPFLELHNQGMILAADHRKMSKSWGNVINPDDFVNEYGADALRTYEMFMAPFSQEIAWSTSAFQGAYRFLKRVWMMSQKSSEKSEPSLLAKLDKTIVKVSEDITGFKFNTAISTMMEFLNAWESMDNGLGRDDLKKFLKILAPFAPFTTEEIWQEILKEKQSIHLSAWPQASSKVPHEENLKLPVQINGKVRAVIEVGVTDDEKIVVEKAKKDQNVQKYITDLSYNIIYKQGKILNFIIKE